jgi:hypothetical protein
MVEQIFLVLSNMLLNKLGTEGIIEEKLIGIHIFFFSQMVKLIIVHRGEKWRPSDNRN